MTGTARFQTGDRVRVRPGDPPYHVRVPRYVRGHTGEIVGDQGRWCLPDDVVRGEPSVRVETVYTVRFEAADLWSVGEHHVTVDLWDSYLEPAVTGQTR